MDFITAILAILLGLLVFVAGLLIIGFLAIYLIMFILWAIIAGFTALFKNVGN
jgi:hypothetical protein